MPNFPPLHSGIADEQENKREEVVRKLSALRSQRQAIDTEIARLTDEHRVLIRADVCALITDDLRRLQVTLTHFVEVAGTEEHVTKALELAEEAGPELQLHRQQVAPPRSLGAVDAVTKKST